MPTIENFLSPTDEAEIINTIQTAEQRTSGEIRVHIEQNCTKAVYDHAIEVFYALKMNTTKLQNAVLIYVAIDKREFVIYGDEGINNKVGSEFWKTTRNKIETQFKLGKFKQGLIDGITETGNVLSKHFPWQFGDTNELDNTISKG